MQTKWLAPACYVGVAALCALYLAIVPGVTLTNVAAGAGIGAALMWAINEWEAGKWKFERVVQSAPASLAVVGPVVAEAAPVTQPVAVAQMAPQPAPVAAREAAPAPPPASSESWKIDDTEPSWDPSALAETWAKLRRDLSLGGSASRQAPPAPDLPRTAQLAKGSQLAKAQLPGLAARSAEASKSPAKPLPASQATGGRYNSTVTPSKSSHGAQPANLSWTARPSGNQSAGAYGSSSHSHPSQAPAQPSSLAQQSSSLRRQPAEPAPQRTAQQPTSSFLRASTMRPR